jgi:phenylalanyl-tRNA synthetase beta chain
MIGEEDIEKVNGVLEDHIEIANAVSKNLKYLRSDLAALLLKNVSSNLRYFKEFRIFEISRIFRKIEGEFKISKTKKETLPMQDKFLGLVSCGGNFFDFKGDIEAIFSSFKIDFEITPSSAMSDNQIYEENKFLEYYSHGEIIGHFGEIKKSVLSNFGIEKTSVFLGEFNFNKMVKYSKDSKVYREIPKFPKMIQDVSMLLDYSSNWKNIESRIESISPLIQDVELFDIYEGDKIDHGFRSIAFHITFYDSTKTLVSGDVEKLMTEIRRVLVSEFKAKIR